MFRHDRAWNLKARDLSVVSALHSVVEFLEEKKNPKAPRRTLMLIEDKINAVAPPDDKIYRVCVCDDSVEVLCLGIDSIDVDCTGVYPAIEKLPKWIQKKLAVLLLIDPTPPNEPVAGLGMRIERNVFWVFAE